MYLHYFQPIHPLTEIEYVLEDGRKVLITFSETKEVIKLLETFDAEDEHSIEQQKHSWKCIFKSKLKINATNKKIE